MPPLAIWMPLIVTDFCKILMSNPKPSPDWRLRARPEIIQALSPQKLGPAQGLKP